MSLVPWLQRGGVYLDSIQFDTTPDPYKPLEWEKRYSEHMTIKKFGELRGMVIQDFGVTPKDNLIILQSGTERLMNEDVVKLMYNRWQRLGVTYTFSDWLGNSFMVFIRQFKAEPFKRGAADSTGGIISLYKYEMELRVTQFLTLFGGGNPGGSLPPGG